MMRVIRTYYKTLSAISPKLAANSAFELFKKVRKKEIRPREKPFYLEAKQGNLEWQGHTIHTYTFGKESRDVVLLLHGWDSNAGCMYRFVEPLLEKGKYVISFNLPAHAFYPTKKTTLLEAKEMFKALMDYLGNDISLSIISHSFGSAVIGYGLSELDLKVKNLAFLTSPDKIEDIFDDYQKFIGINERSYDILKNKVRKVIGEDLSELTISKKLQRAQFDHLHLFHDKKDKILPFSNSLNMHNAVKNSTLHEYEGLGHYRMLWNDDLVNDVIAVIP